MFFFFKMNTYLVEGDRGVWNSRLPYLELPLPALFHTGSRLCSISIIKCSAMLRNFSQFLRVSHLLGDPASRPLSSRLPTPPAPYSPGLPPPCPPPLFGLSSPCQSTWLPDMSSQNLSFVIYSLQDPSKSSCCVLQCNWSNWCKKYGGSYQHFFRQRMIFWWSKSNFEVVADPQNFKILLLPSCRWTLKIDLSCLWS